MSLLWQDSSKALAPRQKEKPKSHWASALVYPLSIERDKKKRGRQNIRFLQVFCSFMFYESVSSSFGLWVSWSPCQLSLTAVWEVYLRLVGHQPLSGDIDNPFTCTQAIIKKKRVMIKH
ncbi:uncharacterized protein ACBT44_002442 [Syngnathus typhle]